MAQNSFLGNDFDPAYIPSSDEKTIALLCHILTLVAPILAPLIIWLIKKEESEFISAHAKESLNFQITLTLVMIILIITIVGLLVAWIIGILSLVWIIVATVRASEGKLYQYPFTLRLIK